MVHISPTVERTVTSASEWNLTSLENTTYHAQYHPLFEIDAFLYEIQNLHPDITELVTLGHSGEGREMYGLKISRVDGQAKRDTESRQGRIGSRRKNKSVDKLGFVITGAQHAREWIATAASLYLAHALVTNTSEAHSLTHLLDEYDFYIIPAPNPDGYDYTWEQDRFWYKNRMILSPNAPCQGLDMNRNWGFKWKAHAPDDFLTTNKEKSPPANPCSHWYPGRRPFQAPEVNNIANYIMTLPNLEAFVDLRSYGQMLSAPFSYSCKKVPKDAEDQLEAALGATNAIKQAHGIPFVAGTLCSTLYRAPGNIVDWMYKSAGVKYSYAAHLRDTGTYGFSLPPQWIRPVGEETGSMIEYLAKFITQPPY